MKATIYEVNTGPWRFATDTDYDPAFVEAVKKRIPARSRKWDRSAGVWLFKANVLDSVTSIMAECYGDYVWRVLDGSPSSAYATLHLLPTAPPGLVRVAYRWLAKNTHPDTGGDTEAMQKLNAAAALLERQRDRTVTRT